MRGLIINQVERYLEFKLTLKQKMKILNLVDGLKDSDLE